jgi:AAA domain
MGALLIIFTGPSATGKTSLAERLFGDLAIPLIAKDAIKEQLFNSLGWSDRAWSRKIGGASYDLIWLLAERILAANAPAIIEGNFRGTVAETRLRAIAAATGCRFFQINCANTSAAPRISLPASPPSTTPCNDSLATPTTSSSAPKPLPSSDPASPPPSTVSSSPRPSAI